jgi:hypothetical protein
MGWTSSPKSRLALEDAGPEDSAELLEILESRPMPGPISVVYTRRPDAYRSLQREGESVGVLVARERASGRVLAMGAFAVRPLYVDGTPTRVAYLFGLRARGDALKTWPVLHRGYAMLRERLRALGVTTAVTTIVESNRRVAAMLARAPRLLPAYRPLGRYDVFALRLGKRADRPAARAAGPGDAGRIADFLNETGRAQQLFPVVRADDLIHGRGVPPLEAFHWLEGRPGEVLAAAALWSQSDYRQYRVHAYARSVSVVRSLAKIAPFLPLPRLPEPGEDLSHATLALWAARDGDPLLLRDLLDRMAEPARAHAFVLAGVHEEHPAHGVFRRRGRASYRSRAYRVEWDASAPPWSERPLYLECGTL